MSTTINDLFDLSGRIALVTGASSGIGRHMAGVLSRAGAGVALVARRLDQLNAAAAEINAATETDGGGRAVALAADLSASGAVDGLPDRLAKAIGAPDILVNAAGVNLRQPPDEVTWQSWDMTVRLNLSVPFFLARSLVPGMVAKGGGNIINIASMQSYRAFRNGAAYGASKGGIVQLTRAMAEAWSSEGVVANAIAPGFFPTELTAPVFGDAEMSAHFARATAIGRNGEMTDLDGATVFLASRGAAYITGQTLPVDGGLSAK